MPAASYREAVGFMVWPSAALLVSSALGGLALDVPRLVRGAAVRGAVGRADVVRAAVAALVTLAVARVAFGLPLLVLAASLPLATALAFVAARAMGETDIVPTKALTPFAQLAFGALAPSVTTTALAPNLTSGVALHAADTLGSLAVARKTGTSARAVLAARMLGCVAGGLAVGLAYAAVVRDPTALPTPELPAPAVLVWRSVAEAAARGVGALGPAVRLAMAIAAGLGLVLAVVEHLASPALRRIVPSAVGLGSGMVLPASSAITLALGAVLRDRLPRDRRALVVPLAAGLVAGESVVGMGWQLTILLRRLL